MSTNVTNNKNIERNENILCAVLALVKELDDSSLEIIKKDIEKKLQKNNLKRILWNLYYRTHYSFLFFYAKTNNNIVIYFLILIH